MRGVSSLVAVVYILAGLLLIQVLATPETTSNAAQSDKRNLIETVRRLRRRDTENHPPGLTVKDVSRSTGLRPNVAVRAADHIIADAAAEKRWEQAHIERDQAWTMHLERDATLTIQVDEEQDGDLTKRSLVMRSAAPKVFGINIYLIIAWLALMYLMYRTGSF
ncbi:hypothetical protein N0V93_010007 [Gnomoniopsis smithogilvyi]|uniref:Uncharacterized protein n=1 Tax=Gnomoniopsis smithogilvyi TaxID=1191159 RepID=A0A9W8YL55_9PEZI|nr:hypothetical protein N0V93_010007 [Gnomoniopsis smithogilvyi]